MVRVPGGDRRPAGGALSRGRALGLGAPLPAPAGDSHPPIEARAGPRGRIAPEKLGPRSTLDSRWYPARRPMPRLFPVISDARPAVSTIRTARIPTTSRIPSRTARQRALSSQETSFATSLVPAQEVGGDGAAHTRREDTITRSATLPRPRGGGRGRPTPNRHVAEAPPRRSGRSGPQEEDLPRRNV